MTSPAGPQITDFDELDEMSGGDEKPSVKLEEIKLDGDGVPESLRGKTAADLLVQMSEMQKALETAKTNFDLLRTASQTANNTPAAPAAPAQEEELSEAQMKELFDTDPFKFHQLQYKNMSKQLLRTVEERVEPLTQNTAVVAEKGIREEFKEEFEVLASEIEQALAQLGPDRQKILANPVAWKQILYYVRGQNMDKLLQSRENKRAKDELGTLRQQEQKRAGPNMETAGPKNAGDKNWVLSPVQQEIAKNLGISEADYRKYYM